MLSGVECCRLYLINDTGWSDRLAVKVIVARAQALDSLAHSQDMFKDEVRAN